jgi:1,4-alpha-glucan branching enzyme
MARAHLALVLHAHLPFVRHPEHPSPFEETWLFEAISECYLPILAGLERLVDEGLPFRLTVSLSPTLVTMLQDPLLQARYLAHAERTVALAEAEVARTRGDDRLEPLARLYRGLWTEARRRFEDDYRRDVTRGFLRLRDAGALELVTTAATHAYLPLLRTERGAVRAQIRVGVDHHHRTFGAPPPGIWLPECGYYPGLEDEIQAAGPGYFFVETHGILHARPRPRHGVHAPVACPNGVLAYGRDPETSRRVWSREVGYPGDPWYRDFYRDVGFDLPIDALRPYLADGETRGYTGLKYYRVTERTEPKAPYDPARAAERVRVHAEDFLRCCVAACARANPAPGRPPLVTAPYDAELFGHWWFEGPRWLEEVIRLAAREPEAIALVTPGDDLARYPAPEVATPSASSWGEGGFSAYWLEERNQWVYPHLHRAARRMARLAAGLRDAPATGLEGRALRQAARSLLLAQASDWAFLMRAGTALEYADRRTRDHLARFEYLEAALRAGRIDPHRLAALEEVDRIFPSLDPRVFTAPEALDPLGPVQCPSGPREQRTS